VSAPPGLGPATNRQQTKTSHSIRARDAAWRQAISRQSICCRRAAKANKPPYKESTKGRSNDETKKGGSPAAAGAAGAWHTRGSGGRDERWRWIVGAGVVQDGGIVADREVGDGLVERTGGGT
jgi:hypothetical protein